MHQEWMCYIVSRYDEKWWFWISFHVLPYLHYCLITTFTFGGDKQKERGRGWEKIKLKIAFCLPWSPRLLQWQNLFCLSRCKNCWTMTINENGLNTCLLETSSSMVNLTIFPWCTFEVVPWWVWWQIINFKGARNDFVVYDVNNPKLRPWIPISQAHVFLLSSFGATHNFIPLKYVCD